MRRMAILMLGCVLGMGTDMLRAQQTSTTQTNPTQNKDIPRQEPGSNNPDLGQQRHEAPQPGSTQRNTSSKKRSHHRKHQSPNTAGSTKEQ
jgi:hypothetical protein